MSQDLVSTAPGIFQALFSLVQTAGNGQNPKVSVFAFEVGQYEPATYVTVHAIENHEFEWESIGSFSQRELYDVVGCVSVYTGDSPNTNPAVAGSTLTSTYNAFQTLVMTPVMSNRTMPLLGTAGPSPFLMLPGSARYSAGPGDMGETQAGWVGRIDFSFHFEAVVTPA